MDKDLDFTPEVNSKIFLNILDTIEELSFANTLDVTSIEVILNTKSAQQLFALDHSLSYLFFKESLTRHIFDFLLETPHIILINKFLMWFKELIFDKPELLEILNKLTQWSDLERILNQLNQLNSDNVITKSEEYDVVFASLELIKNKLNPVEYIHFLKNSEQPYILANAIISLKNENLLVPSYLEFVSDTSTTQYYPIIKVLILTKLSEAKILTEENFQLCVVHSNLVSLENILQILSEQKKGYLEKYFKYVIRKKAKTIQIYLHFLKKNRLLEELCLDLLMSLNGSKLEYFVEILSLSESYLKENVNKLIIISSMKKNYLRKIVESINLINFEGYLNNKVLDLLLSNRIPSNQIYEFSQSYIVLYTHGLNEEHWVDKIFLNPKGLMLSICMVNLHRINILSLEKFNEINHVELIEYYYRIIKNLNILKIFNKSNFENIIVLSRNIDLDNFKKISLKKNVFEDFYLDIFNIVRDQKINQLDKSKKILELLDKDYSKKRTLPINPVESTHLASINQGFTNSIQEFKESYGRILINLDLNEYYKEIENDLDNEFKDDDPVKFLAAKRALNGIIRDPNFFDEQSQLNLEKIFVLLWEGIQDESQRSGTLSDAKKQLLEGLYEIQRGGNFNAQGIDNNLSDEPICCRGGVHKLLEKLVGIHSFLDFSYITPELASLKLPIIIQEEANNYLLSIDPYYVFQNYDRLKEQGVSAIWKEIEFKVRERMLDEFGILYISSESGRVSDSFEILLNNYQYVDLNSDLLNSIKVSQSLKKLEFSLVSQESCKSSEHSSSRKTRNINPCFEDKMKGKKIYWPALIKSSQIKKSISFLMGILDDKKKSVLIKKISSFNYNKASSEGNNLEKLEPILQEKLLDTDIDDQVDIVELENTSGSKAFLSVKKNDEIEKINYHIYCSDINSQIFLKFDFDLNFGDIIELYKQLLFPQEASFYIKTKFFKYTIPKDQIINELEPSLPIKLNWIKSSYHLESFDNLLINEELWSFFLVDDEVITSANQINIIKLDLTRRPFKFILEKITAIFSLDIQQQINLGNILNSPYVEIAQIQDPDITSDNLNQFRINLLVKIIEASKKNYHLTHYY